VLQAQGSWSVVKSGQKVGDAACESLGRDEVHGLEAAVVYSLCEQATKHVGEFQPKLCCRDGRYVTC